MTAVYFTEYARQARDVAGYLVAAGEDPPLAEHNVTVGASAQSDVLNAKTSFVEIVFRVAAHMTIAANPTATVANTYYPAGTVLFRGVPANSGLRYAVVVPV